MNKRVVITGMSVNTPLGDTLEGFLKALLAGRSAIGKWKAFDTSEIDVKIGGDLSGYDIEGKASSLRAFVPDDVSARLDKIIAYVPWSVRLSVLLAVDAIRDAGLFASAPDFTRISAVIGGHDLDQRYNCAVCDEYRDALYAVDARYALNAFNTNHAGCVADVAGVKGPLYTVGGACATGNVALRCALDELRYHDVDASIVVGAVLDVSPAYAQANANMGAIATGLFEDEPARASRPFDVSRQGFILSHGGAALVLEEMGYALARGARIYGEVMGIEVNSSASRLPTPFEEDEARVMSDLLRRTGTEPREVDFVSAHATSTPQGDLAEIRAIKKVFGDHARTLKINAPKSLLGHCTTGSATVETVAAVLQMRAGELHPSINIDQLDPEIDLDVCANRAVKHQVRCFLKNAFGFGGINAACLVRRFDGGP